jgi:predicted nucleic-acid-binding Zn-ribbon protein
MIFILIIMYINTCYKYGNSNSVNGTLGTPAQPIVNVFQGNTALSFQKLKTGTCLNCGFVEVYLDRDDR